MPSEKCILNKGSRRQGTDSSHGIDFEIKLLVLFLLRALKDKIKFNLLSNVTGYGCWDDLIVQYDHNDKVGNNSRIALVQVKHTLDPINKKLKIRDLKGCNSKTGNKDSSFDLRKYYDAYLIVSKALLRRENVAIDYIIYCNKKFSTGCPDYIKSDIEYTNKSFQLLNSNDSKAVTKLNLKKLIDENKITNVPYDQTFSDSLSFYMEQSSESDLDKVIKKEYQIKYPNDDFRIVETVFQEVLKNVKTWRNKKVDNKANIINFLTEEDRIFETARENAILQDIQSRNIQDLDRSIYQDLHFSQNYLIMFMEDISGPVVNIFTTKNAATLSTLKVFKAFQEDGTTPIIINIQMLAKYYKFKMISSKETKQILIVNCIDKTDDYKNIFEHFEKMLKVNLNYKMIFIRNDLQTISYLKAEGNDKIINYIDYYNLNQFTFPTGKKVLKKSMKMQKREFKMSCFISKTSILNITPDIMQDLLEERISIGPKIECLKSDAHYYFPKMIHRDDLIMGFLLSNA